MTWETFCKRTNDPKLRAIESLLYAKGIPSRRNGRSFHAPILQVPHEHMDEAWKMLSEDIDGRKLDDIPDNDPIFSEV